MSTFTTHSNARAGAMAFALETLGNALFGVVGTSLRQRNDRRVLDAELSRLSERELLDIGLAPGDVNRSFWDEIHPVEMTLRRP